MRTFGKLIHETFRNANVVKSTNVTTPAPPTRPIQCRPVVVVLAGFHPIVYIQFFLRKMFGTRYGPVEIRLL